MEYSYPSVFRKKEELETIIDTPMRFDADGFLIDPDLKIQRKLEDYYEHVIIKIEPTVRNNIIITMEGNGFIQTNPLTGRRLAAVKGDLDYLKATYETMIREHPRHAPQTILDSCVPSCKPADHYQLRKWMEDRWDFH